MLLLAIISAVYLLSVNIFAQNTEQNGLPVNHAKFYLGSSGGLNLAGMFGSEIDQIKNEYYLVPKLSENIWLQFGYKPLRWLAIESGVGIVGKGLGYRIPVDGYDANYKIRYSDIFYEIPLTIKPAILFPGGKMLFGIAGLSYERQLTANYKVDVSYTDFDGNSKKENTLNSDLLKEGISLPTNTLGGKIVVPYKDLYRMNDISLILGMGLEIGGWGISHSSTFVIELKYLLEC